MNREQCRRCVHFKTFPGRRSAKQSDGALMRRVHSDEERAYPKVGALFFSVSRAKKKNRASLSVFFSLTS